METIIKGGVIIIGSLLWQDDLNAGDELRKNWRKNFLGKQTFKVRLPIRYGRTSKSNIITMVYSKECEKIDQLGIGIVKPFKAPTSKSKQTFLNKVVHVAAAEGCKDKKVVGTSGGNTNKYLWCLTTLLINPNTQPCKKVQIKKWYIEKLRTDLSKVQLRIDTFSSSDEPAVIDEEGLLNISFPEAFNYEEQAAINQFDFLVATVTKPDQPYPAIETLKTSIRLDTSRKYFINNRKVGIETFQDELILAPCPNNEKQKENIHTRGNV